MLNRLGRRAELLGTASAATFVLGKVQGRPHYHKGDDQADKTHQIALKHGSIPQYIHTALAVFFLPAPLVVIVQLHNVPHAFEFFGALLQRGPHHIACGEHTDALALALYE